jgi:hypothetical protein
MTEPPEHPLGPKGGTYVELAREEWRAPLERASVRRSLLTALLSLVLIVMGAAGAYLASVEALALVGLGALGLYTTWADLQLMRYEFEESRRVGWVEVALDEEQLTIGDPFTVRLTWHARRAFRVTEAQVLLSARHWRGNTPGAVEREVAATLTGSDDLVRAGESWRASATMRTPLEAPPSHYDVDASLRWVLAVQVHFAGVAPWARELPVLVYPAPG